MYNLILCIKIALKRGDIAVEQYFKNPEYYLKDLKKLDQSSLSHETPLELYESDGQFFINGGNNRLSLIMMEYLAEMYLFKYKSDKN